MTGGADVSTAVTFVAEIVGVRRKGLTEFELVSRDCDHSALVAVPEWGHGRFSMGERVRVTVERLDAPDLGERPADELERWVLDHPVELGAGMSEALRSIALRIDERCEDEVAYAVAQHENEESGV